MLPPPLEATLLSRARARIGGAAQVLVQYPSQVLVQYPSVQYPSVLVQYPS
jgi:hypothetical protein